MARYNYINNSFVVGEISPRAYGRTDLPQYQAAVKRLDNFIIYPQGGAGRRVGSVFCNTTDSGQTQNTQSRLIPFVFSESEAYQIEINENGMWFINVTTPTVKTAISTVQNISSVSSGFVNVTVAHFAGIDLNEIQYAQDADLLYLVHSDRKPIIIARTAADAFEIRTFERGGNTGGGSTSEVWEAYPYLEVNTDTGKTLTPAATSGTNIDLTATGFTFGTDVVGSIFRLSEGANTGVGVVRSRTSDTVVKIDILVNFASTGARSDWDESAFSPERGWPRTVSFYEERICYGGTQNNPDRLFLSKTANPRKMMFPLLKQTFGYASAAVGSDPFSRDLKSNKVSEVQWLSPGKTLTCGTRGTEYVIKGFTSAAALANDNFFSSPETNHGSHYVQAIRISNAVVFIQAAQQKIREFRFNFDEDSFQSADISILSEHFPRKSLETHDAPTAPGIVAMQYQEADNGIIWVLDNNGGLFAVTRDVVQQVISFHNHFLGGNFNDAYPVVESISVVPSSDGTHDDLWLIVKRTVDGRTVRYIERIGQEFEAIALYNSSASIADKPVYSDSCVFATSGTAKTSWDNFYHLSEETISVVGNGQYLGDFTISCGSNLITNSTADVDLSGWSTYDDGGADNPVDGTGGSPSYLTLTRTTGTPITGPGSFVLTKSSSGSAYGEGVSYDFTMGSSGFSKFHRIKFNFNSTGDFASGFIRVAIYNVTNSALITVLDRDVSATSGIFSAIFQAHASATSYRVILHTKENTGGTSWTFTFDDVDVCQIGVLTLPSAVSEIIAGLKYKSVVQLLPPEAGTTIGSSQGTIQRVDRAVIRFNRTLGAKFGYDDTNLDHIEYRPWNLDMDTATPLFTGDKVLEFPHADDRASLVTVVQELPLPCSVTSVISRGVTFD